jgi:hypothetical protein
MLAQIEAFNTKNGIGWEGGSADEEDNNSKKVH